MADKPTPEVDSASSINALLEAADGYVPILQSVLWILFLVILAVAFRHQLKGILAGIKTRIDSGAQFKVAGLEVGQLVKKTSDLGGKVEVFGNPDQLKLLFKVQGPGWKKSTKAMELPNGCVIQVTTERQSNDGDWANAEAMVFVPDVALQEVEDGSFRVVAK